MKKIIEYCLFVLMVSEDRKKGRKIKKIKKIYPGLSGSCFAAIHKQMEEKKRKERLKKKKEKKKREKKKKFIQY